MRSSLAELGEARAAFQPWQGHRPKELLDRHPDGRHVSLLAYDVTARLEQAGIWNMETGEPVWAPDRASLLAWADQGRQILFLRTTYQPALNRPVIAASPLQSEFTNVLERWSWPERKLLATCPIHFSTGTALELVASPAINLVAITWLEQDCAGFVLVRWGTPSGDFQLGGVGPYGDGYYVEPNLIQGPVFSPDGRYAAASCSLWSWWAPGGDPETPSPGGRIKAGHIAVLDTDTMRFTEKEVMTQVPRGWLPPDRGFGAEELIGYPEFPNSRQFRVKLPTGQIEYFDLS